MPSVSAPPARAPIRWRQSATAEPTAPSAPADTHPASPDRLPYLPALDGLRAAAVMAVLLYHGGVEWMRGGYLGVDAFFVLSGFLITALLLSEWRTSGGIGFAAFWLRRARRLLPALALVMAGVLVYAAFLAPAHQLAALRSDVLSTLGYVTNWRLIFSGQGYFEQFAVPSPLRHAWSLAIEEQFYLLWPLVVYALCRWARLSWRAMAVLFAALAVASAGWMAFLFTTSGVSRAYYGTDTRAQALFIGAALAVVFLARGTIRHAVVGRALGIASIAAVAVTAWLWATAGEESAWLYEGGFLLAAIAIAAIVARVVQPRTGILGAVFSVRPLRWVGWISYGLYLWHWPIYVVLTTDRTGLDGTSLLLARLAVTFAVAASSYYLVELPIRNGALRRRRSLVVVPVAAVALVAGVLVVTSGAKSVIATGDAERAALADVRAANRAAERALAAQAHATVAARPLRVLVLGDSVALTLGLGLQEVGMEQNLIAVNKSKMGCGITHGGDVWVSGTVEAVRGDCGDWALRWAAARDELDPDVAVLLLGAWDAYDRRLDDTWIPFGTPESDELLMSDLRGAVDVLAHDGTKVVFATVPYFENRFVVNRPDEFRSSFDPWRVDHFNELIRAVARADAERVAIVDLNQYLSPDGQFHGDIAGQVIQDDGMHFGVDGRKAVAAWVAPRLQQIVGAA